MTGTVDVVVVVVVVVVEVVEGGAVVVEVVEVVVVGALVVVVVACWLRVSGSSAAQLVTHAANTTARIVDRVVCLVLVEHLSGLVGCSVLRSLGIRWILFIGSSSSLVFSGGTLTFAGGGPSRYLGGQVRVLDAPNLVEVRRLSPVVCDTSSHDEPPGSFEFLDRRAHRRWGDVRTLRDSPHRRPALLVGVRVFSQDGVHHDARCLDLREHQARDDGERMVDAAHSLDVESAARSSRCRSAS